MFMKHLFLIPALLATSLTIANPAIAADAVAPAAKPAYSISETDIGTLVDNPVIKALIDKILPGVTANPQFEMARSMTFKQVQGYAPDQFPDAKLAELDAELAKLPAAK
jgi:hypothetical protein